MRRCGLIIRSLASMMAVQKRASLEAVEVSAGGGAGSILAATRTPELVPGADWGGGGGGAGTEPGTNGGRWRSCSTDKRVEFRGRMVE